MNFYEEKIQEIKDLIKNSKDEKALQILLSELNMPYIPRKYEEQFNDLRNVLIMNQPEVKEKSMTAEETLEALYSSDEIRIMMSLRNMKNLNLRPVSSQIVKWMESAPKYQRIIVANIYEILYMQQIDVDITIDGISLNPAKDKNPLKSEFIKKTLNSIEILPINEVLWKQHATDQTMLYVLNIFPKPLEKDYSKQMINIVAFLFGEKTLTLEEEVIALKLGHNISKD